MSNQPKTKPYWKRKRKKPEWEIPYGSVLDVVLNEISRDSIEEFKRNDGLEKGEAS